MTNFIMIENNSGYVWGAAEADTAAKACQSLAAKIDGYGPAYEDCGRPNFSNETGFHVYDGTGFDINTIGNGDGQNEELIAAVSALPNVGYFRPISEEVDA